ncbi:unnamed protein product [Ixodes persulcatus]
MREARESAAPLLATRKTGGQWEVAPAAVKGCSSHFVFMVADMPQNRIDTPFYESVPAYLGKLTLTA